VGFHRGERKRALNAPKRPGISCLLLGLLLAGSAFFSASQLKAQPPLPGPIPTVSPRGDVSPNRAQPLRSGAEGIGKGQERGSDLLREEETAIENNLAEVVEVDFEWQGEALDSFEYEEETGSESIDEEEMGVEWVYGGLDPGEKVAREGKEVDRKGEEVIREGQEAVDGFVEVPKDVGIEREAEQTESEATATPAVETSFRQRTPPEEVPFVLSGEPYRYPGQLLEPHWNDCLKALESGSTSSLRSALNRLYEAKLDGGFGNMPDYSTLLIRRAHRLFDEQDILAARLLGDTAYNLAPEYYPVSLSLSRLAVRDPGRGLGKYLSWRWVSLKQRLGDFLWQFTTVGKVFGLLLIALYLFFLLLGLYLIGRYARVLLHFVHERIPGGSFGTAAVAAVLSVTVLVLLFLPGPFWVTVFLGFVSGRFARRWEKACFCLFLLFWAASPWVFNQTVCFFSPLSDATNAIHRCIQGDWNASGEEALEAGAQTNPESMALSLTRALVEKRRGEYEQATRVLTKALRDHPQAARLWNNLGNLHAIEGNLADAKAAYRKAILYGNGSAAPHYNLGQLLRREFSFLRGAQEFQAARKIDAKRVDYFAYIHSPNPNRYFIDEEPPKVALWSYASYRDPETERTADDLWRSTAAGIPLRQTPWVFLALIVVYVLFVSHRRSGQEPFACSACGQVVCGKCDKGAQVGGLCSPCYQALYQRENIPKERRREQIRKMARFQSRRSRRLLILNLLLPGLGFSLLEERPRGTLILFGFLFLVLVGMFWSAMLPVPMTVWETGVSVLRILSIVLLIVLYVLVQQKFFAKVRARR
jgi:tetratricopeptide (TPR) repeat protein